MCDYWRASSKSDLAFACCPTSGIFALQLLALNDTKANESSTMMSRPNWRHVSMRKSQWDRTIKAIQSIPTYTKHIQPCDFFSNMWDSKHETMGWSFLLGNMIPNVDSECQVAGVTKPTVWAARKSLAFLSSRYHNGTGAMQITKTTLRQLGI